jgi:hypothetical protein
VPDNGILIASTVAATFSSLGTMVSSQHVYEIRPREDRRGFDLTSDSLPLGLLWFEGPEATKDAVNYARFFSRSHPAIIRVFDDSGRVAETLEFADDFSRVVNISARSAIAAY